MVVSVVFPSGIQEYEILGKQLRLRNTCGYAESNTKHQTARKMTLSYCIIQSNKRTGTKLAASLCVPQCLLVLGLLLWSYHYQLLGAVYATLAGAPDLTGPTSNLKGSGL